MAREQCEYCHTQARVTGIPLEVDHIMPLSAGGETCLENLCMACGPCNRHKSDRLEAADPQTGQRVPLFHPRHQHWDEHFTWSKDDTRVVGLTPSGRATVVTLDLNSELRVRARGMWVIAGWHPPDE